MVTYFFPALHFDVTTQSVSGVTGRTPDGLSFAYRSRKKCMWIAVIIVLRTGQERNVCGLQSLLSQTDFYCL